MIIRQLEKRDFDDLDKYFGSLTEYKNPISKWENYLHQQSIQQRAVRVVEVDDQAIGIGTLKFTSDYTPFQSAGIPEINDILIEQAYRYRGYGRALISSLEERAREDGYTIIGLAVGLYQDYGKAQRLYVKMGYIPDGRGITYKHQQVIPGNTYTVDDDLLLWLTKSLELRTPQLT